MEVWKTVADFEIFYEVSSLGRVRSLDRIYQVTDRRWNKSYQVKCSGRVLKPNCNPYAGYALTRGRNTPKVYITGHILVAEAFLPNPDNLPFVHHINHDKMDNRVENLKRVSAKENAEEFQKFAASTTLWKKRISRRKSERFTEKQLTWMQMLREQGHTYSDLSEIFNISRDQIPKIISTQF